MARISSYPLDTVLQDTDAWIGSDAITRQTKQYTPELLANYLNLSGKVSVSGQMVFKFTTTQDPLDGQFTGPAAGSPIAAITTLRISSVDSSKEEIVNFLEYLVGESILISEQSKTSRFGHFKIVSYTADDGFYVLDLESKGGNGNLSENKNYDFALFSLERDISTINFVFTQGVANITWTVQHNLNKFPSCTTTTSTGRQGFGNVEFIDKNNLTITFAFPETGKAYIN
tara:strand:+ start:329 stop:1015 length:687 start_codon:yes stop_codon:yes gene_type:complete